MTIGTAEIPVRIAGTGDYVPSKRVHSGEFVVTVYRPYEFLDELAGPGACRVAQKQPQRAIAGVRAGHSIAVLGLDLALGDDTRHLLFPLQ